MKIFFILVAIIFCSSCLIRKSEPIVQRQFDPKDDQVLNGERVYMMHCEKCHPGGEAGLGPSIVSNPAPQFIKNFQIRHGLGVMPSFSQKEITNDELKSLAKYMKAWKKY